MKSFKYIISSLLLAGSMGFVLSSCSEDKLDPNSIFPEIDERLDPSSATYQLDVFLRDNYLKPYNLDFRYKMQDVGTNMNYNLVPATYANSVDLAVLTKYLWFDAYAEVVNEDFLKLYGPRIIHLIGSPAYNPTSGTMILGLAEGGIKVSLFRVNEMNINDFYTMNDYYFKTMHHEFSHILHQTKTYPSEFNTVSVGHYDSNNWSSRDEGVVNSLGFVTNYASSEFREDFAESIATFIVLTDKQWERIYDKARRGWESPSDETDFDAVYYCYYYTTNNSGDEADKKYAYESEVNFVYNDDGSIKYMHFKNEKQKGIAPITKGSDGIYRDAKGQVCNAQGYALDAEGNTIPIYVYDVPDKDGVNGPEVIDKKIQICRQWLLDEWGVNLDKLREVVQRRQANYDIEELRKQVYSIN